jgi:Reverse transcriptase (RNA-dependent DNA polymerase)
VATKIKWKIIDQFEDYLQNMQHYTLVNNIDSEYAIFKNGVFQGSKLATLLFNIFINDICEIDINNICLYADDTLYQHYMN